MEPKRCSRCGGLVNVETIRHEKGGTSVIGTCRGCGATFDEGDVLKLTTPAPVGG
jgi:hypothetical protein